MKIITNNVPRNTIDAYELTEKERQEFDYLDWEAIDEGNESGPLFFRYKCQLYNTGEFMRTESEELKDWQGISADGYFSGVLVKFSDDMEQVIVGRYYS